MIPSECHLTLYETVDCVVNPLPLKDLPIVGHVDKTEKKVMMHGDVGIGVDGLKELDPDPSTYDGIMEHGPSHIHYELVPPLPVTSHQIISTFQQEHQAFPHVKVKTTNENIYDHTYLFQSILWWQNYLIMGRTCSIMQAFNTCGNLLAFHSLFYFAKASR
jgi:hypothetical protein